MHTIINVPNGTSRQKPTICRLRQKKKIRPSDNLSIEKDFPRFYAKYRDRSSSSGNSESDGSRSSSPISSEEEYTTKRRLCRLIDPMKNVLNDRLRLNSLSVEIHRLNKSYKKSIDNNNNYSLTHDHFQNQGQEFESGRVSPDFPKLSRLKSRLSELSLSESGYASNPDLTESPELSESEPSPLWGECFVTHQPEKVTIKIVSGNQNFPDKRPLSRCTIRINSFDYFSKECSQTLDQFKQTESPVSLETMESSHPTSLVNRFQPSLPIKDLPSLPKQQISYVTLNQDDLSGDIACADDECAKIARLGDESVENAYADGSSEERISHVDVFLVQDSWLMLAEGEVGQGKVPCVIYSHRKGEEPRGRWAIMQEVLSENRKLRENVQN